MSSRERTACIRWKGEYTVRRDDEGNEERQWEFVKGRLYEVKPDAVPDYGRLTWAFDQIDGVSASMSVSRSDDDVVKSLEISVFTHTKEQRNQVHGALVRFNAGEIAVPTITKEQHRAFQLNSIALRESDGLFGFQRLCANPACKQRCDQWCYAEPDPDQAIEKASIRGNWFCSAACCLIDSGYCGQLEEALMDAGEGANDWHGVFAKCKAAGLIKYENGPDEPPTGFAKGWLDKARTTDWWTDLLDRFNEEVLDHQDGDPPEDTVECEI